MNVLFLSKDNIARSQIAQAFFNWLSETNKKEHKAFSAGTDAHGKQITLKEIGPAAEGVIQVMSEEGVDVSVAIRKQLQPLILHRNNIKKIILISTETFPESVVMTDQLVHWDIKDPKRKPIEDVRTIKDQIKRKVIELWKEIDNLSAEENKTAQ